MKIPVAVGFQQACAGALKRQSNDLAALCTDYEDCNQYNGNTYDKGSFKIAERHLPQVDRGIFG